MNGIAQIAVCAGLCAGDGRGRGGATGGMKRSVYSGGDRPDSRCQAGSRSNGFTLYREVRARRDW